MLGLVALVLLSTPPQAKLQAEFEKVAKGRESELIAHARDIIRALQKWDVAGLVEECTMYDAKAKDRLALTQKYFDENRSKLQRAVKGFDPDAKDFGERLEFRSPEPEAGMTGQVVIPFGPKAKPPKDAGSDELFPETHELELWWSGEVMPEANGPLYETAPTPKPKSRWRFHQLITPYSQRPSYRL